MALRRVFVANRGEIAVRIVRACRTLGIEAVLGVSQPDVDSLGASLADRVVVLGPGPADRSYLDADALISAASATGCDAVHPGYGFLAERAGFAAAVEEAGLVFVGPTPESIRFMGDKLAARAVAHDAGVPVVPGSDAVGSVDEAVKAAAEVGYPLMLKASAGGGGRGIKIVESDDALRAVFDVATAEVGAAFGDSRVFLERYVPLARHIEVQVLGDGRGQVVTLGERDCSLQRRYQKLVEEAPAYLPYLSSAQMADLRERLYEAARSLGAAISYRGAGTVEFIVDQRRGEFFFLEMNTRIQVEHPVTEAVTGVDLVEAQLQVAGGEGLSVGQADVELRGHAIEVRLTAEDVAAGFLPSPGLITGWHSPGGPGIRIDTHCYPGYAVPVFYDSMLGKLIAHGEDRPTAIRRLRAALQELRIEGISTTREFLLELLSDPDVQEGRIDTGWIERSMAGRAPQVAG
jgi:acetyl-CoA carboxylase biotin carboxylase subunit